MKSKGRKKIIYFIVFAIISSWLIFSLSAMRDVFNRNTDSVDNTSWLSFDSGKLNFDAQSGSWNTSEGIKQFSFSENSGIITIVFSDQSTKFFIRQGQKELISNDGRGIWYLYVSRSPTVE